MLRPAPALSLALLAPLALACGDDGVTCPDGALPIVAPLPADFEAVLARWTAAG